MSQARAEVVEDDSICDELPAGWAVAKLGEFLPLTYGKALPARTRNESGMYPVFGSSGVVGSHDDHIAPENSIIVGRKGTAGSVYFSEKACWPIDTAYFATLPKEFEPRYWYFQLHALQLGRLDQSTAIPSLSRDNYNPICIRIPPPAEQKRIVSKIDELFSDIEAGERALKRARAALARYRKSVLKAAVTGELTADWRAANKDKLEPAEKLLAHILAARREAWEKAEHAKLKAQGKSSKGEEWKKKYKEPAAPEPDDLGSMPDGWILASGAHFYFWSSGDFLPTKKMLEGPYHVYGGNGVNGRHSEANVREQTIVVGRVGVHCGNVHITHGPTWVTDNAIFATVQSEAICRVYAAYVMQNANLRQEAQGGAQPFVNQKALNEAIIPTPPLVEQFEIVSRVEEAFSKADHVEAALDEQERAARALKQSILKAAFEGRLVPQDPADEPAAKLLERIKREKKK